MVSANLGYRIEESVDTITDDSVLELLIFSPSPSLQHNLEALLPRSDWDQALRDPFGLLVIVLDDLFRQLDAAMHKVLHILRDVERVVLESADTKGLESSFDFHAIHNIAKHIIHLKESSSAAKLLAGHITDQHRELMSQSDPGSEIGVMQGVQGLLQHKQTLLENCQVRVQAMDSRAQNMINLVSRRRICTHETVQELIQPQAFNTVNQQDSKVMKSDSQSMKVIAVVTMLFLPAATVGLNGAQDAREKVRNLMAQGRMKRFLADNIQN
ncbi:MAG: hypothetical protein L6R37_008096 [Teloschistes peruensis]|nr:MAG: hypothetical protein L6R37_008096 [Teloschistes peruensis]